MIRKISLVLFIVSFYTAVFAQQNTITYKYNLLLTGASFASPENRWFEMGCHVLGANPINRAIGGEAIASTANRMADGTLYSKAELENLDALVIMQVHERDVFEPSQLKENYHDYPTPFERINYAAAFDYVIKRYISECYELKNDPQSKYYNTPTGKPAVIVLCTDWHDARVVYNTSVRQLAEKWGFPVVEFDKNIGFSKNQVHPVTHEHYSLLYSTDTQELNGIKYGWHPIRGEASYIQQRMAAIFAHKMKEILPLK
ncbi:DUF5040 domain-containing protein [Parabacteroides sp. PF5-9]|uniref:DUF5040 domain-containing protein n=1 Tax=Parabacteroides sp. PF5-9 TaxID=1742404 RepID=UPI002474F5F0|nr:DUF5040 domain-containing protein [Parabacteroides sp. PF5-9]MDH6358436.1 hypothetical protein [Parabacteroides sp. PF5-9]